MSKHPSGRTTLAKISYTSTAHASLRCRYEYRKSQAGRRRIVPDNEAPLGRVVVVFIIGNRAYTPYSTGIETTREIWDSRWDPKPSSESKELLREMNAFETLAEDAYRQLLKAQPVVTGQMLIKGIKSAINGDEQVVLTLVSVYNEFMAARRLQIQDRIDQRKPDQISGSTYRSYPKRWSMITAYLHATKQSDVPVVNVDYPFAFKCKEWLQKQPQPNGKLYESSTINKAISLLKQILGYATGKGHIKAHPLLNFVCRGGSPANPKPLTEEQMQLLETCELPIMLRRFCDSWLVAGELCLHYSDFVKLKESQFVRRDDQRYLQIKRTKQQDGTLTQTVDVTPRAERIIAKYGGVQNLEYTSSAYFSKVLKQIASRADLRDSEGNLMALQFGQGRDTGLTQRAIEGANSIQLSKMGGWSRAAYAERYVGDPVGVVEAFVKSKQRKEVRNA